MSYLTVVKCVVVVVRTSLYVQVRSIVWLGGRVSDDVVGALRSAGKKCWGCSVVIKGYLYYKVMWV